MSKPYFEEQIGYVKQIYIIDNSGSMIARSGLFETRLNRSLELVRKHAKVLRHNNIEVYKWNSLLKKLISKQFRSKTQSYQTSHLPNSNFFYLIERIKDFIKKGYKVSLFTDALEYEEQLNLSNLGVEVFLSAQNNRNIYFESIDANLLNDRKLKFNIKVSCTSLGGGGILLISQKGVLPLRLPFQLKDYDSRQFDFEIKPVSLSDPIRFELLPDEPDLLVEDNLVEYFIDSKIPRIALLDFSDSALFSKLFKDFLISDKRFLLDSNQFQIPFINVKSLPSKPQALTVYIIEGKGTKEDFKESRSHILEYGHPLVRFVGGNNLSAAKNLNLVLENSEWDSIIKIEQNLRRRVHQGL